MTVNNNDILRVTAKMSHAGNDIQNVHHIRYTGTGDSDTDVFDECLDWIDDAYASFSTYMTTITTFDSIEVRNLTQNVDLGEDNWPTRTTGGAAGDSMPMQTTPLILFNTETPGSQGRKYLPFITETNHDGLGDLSSAVVTAMVSYAGQLLIDRILTNGTLAHGNWNKDLARFAPWVGSVVKDFLHTQRRRLKGVGS